MITLPGVDPRMIANNLEPYEPTHPGEVVRDELVYQGLSTRELAEIIGVDYKIVDEIVNCKHPVSAEFAMLVDKIINIDANILVGLQADYDLLTAKRNKAFINRVAKANKTYARLKKERSENLVAPAAI